VTTSAGATIHHDFARLLDAARAAGFTPRHRKPFVPASSQTGRTISVSGGAPAC